MNIKVCKTCRIIVDEKACQQCGQIDLLEYSPVYKNTFGNKEITKTLEILKREIEIDDFKESVVIQRGMAKHILALGAKIGKEEMIQRLELILSDNWKLKNCNSITYLYKELKSFIKRTPKIESKKYDL